jgi:hypothetical protein
VVEAEGATRIDDVLGRHADKRLLAREQDIEALLDALAALDDLVLCGIEESANVRLARGGDGIPPREWLD